MFAGLSFYYAVGYIKMIFTAGNVVRKPQSLRRTIIEAIFGLLVGIAFQGYAIATGLVNLVDTASILSLISAIVSVVAMT